MPGAKDFRDSSIWPIFFFFTILYMYIYVYCLWLSPCLQAGERSGVVGMCCRFSTEHSTLHWAHQAAVGIFPPWAPAGNPGQAHPGVTRALPMEDFCPAHGGFLPSLPGLPWLGATVLSQIYFLSLCAFPKWGVRGSATEKLFGMFIHVKTSPEQGTSLGSMPCGRFPIHRQPWPRGILGSALTTDISWEILPGHQSRVFRVIKSTFFVTQFLCRVVKKWVLISLMVQPKPFPRQSKSCHWFHLRLF